MSSLIQVNELRTKYVVHYHLVMTVAGAIVMAHFAGTRRLASDRPHGIGLLLSLIGSGLTICVLGAAAYDIGRAFSVW